jgi:serine/threonine protein kinase
MGRVWLAQDTTLRREVAVKEVVFPAGLDGAEREELRRRMMREARAAARLSHPNVVQVYDVIGTDEPSIVMEYIRSRSLQQVIRTDGPLDPQRAARIGLAVLAALTAAHRAGVLHRDVKPGNVLIADDGRIVLTDFGLAIIQGGDGAVTLPGSILGSPEYIAPERAREGVSTAESDLWSLGATLYAAVEGRAPYARETTVQTLLALATTRPDPPQRAGALQPVLAGLLRRNPRARISPEDAERLLSSVAEGRPRPRRLLRPRGLRASRTPVVEPEVPDEPDTPVLTDVGRYPTARLPGSEAGTAPPDDRAEAVGDSDADSGADSGDGSTAAGLPIRSPASDLPTSASRASDLPTSASPPAEPIAMGAPPAEPIATGAPPAGSTAAGAPPADRPVADGSGTDPDGDAATLATTGDTPARRRRYGRALAVALLLLVVGAAATIAARTAGTGGTGPRFGSHSASPTRITTAGTPPPVNQVELAPPASGEYALPTGWGWYHDPTGYGVAAPLGWTATVDGGTVSFAEPGGTRTLTVERLTPPVDPPADLTRLESARLSGDDLRGYAKLRLEPWPYFQSCADWEYTYDAPGGTRTHVLHREFTTAGGQAYRLTWRTNEFDWQVNRANFLLITASFHPPA